MSLTSRERRNPPSRRKSCAACIKAKRRCDGATPVCLRCGNRGISCDYPLRKIRRSASSKARDGRDTTPQDLGGDELLGSLDFLDESPAENTATSLLTDIDEVFHCPGSSLDFCLDPASLSQELVHQTTTLVPPASSPLLLGASAVDIAARRLQFSLDETQKALVTMAEEMQTPWSHPLLYRDSMPKSIRDAHASCALYSMKTRTNGPVILRSVESYVEELLRSDPAPNLRDRLAHTQSLILYQIIRLLDGDIRARGAAERQLITLEESALALLPFIDFDRFASKYHTLPLHPPGSVKASWHDWILHESARRTFLFSFFFLQAYRILAGPLPSECDPRLLLCRALTVSTPLWNARTAAAFADAWNERRFTIVANGDLDGILREGNAEDVDSFAKILMSSAMGVEEAEEWFALRGSSLRDK